MKKLNCTNSEKGCRTETRDKSSDFNNNDKGYFEFLKDAKNKQRNLNETSNINKGLWDDSDYNAIFMTF